MMENRFGHMY